MTWKAGIYARLSVDHHNQKNDSIDTQIQIAKEYISRSDQIELVECYTDLGKSGTNFQREGFERMMADVRSDKINCIIVKDFSRFGRNYIETGNYIEKIFPFFHVRFISVTDGYDSHRTEGSNDFFSVNLKNIVNELYARDCAEKVKAIKKAKLEQGSYVGGIPSYGYQAQWIGGRKILFPEKDTGDVVRKIYNLFDQGYTCREIISYLYDHRIHRPKEYRSTGHVYCEEGEMLRQWSDITIETILTNHVYIGALVQIRIGEKVYRSRGRQDIEPNEVIMMEHTHEALIDEDLFYRVSSKMGEKKEQAYQKRKQFQEHGEDRYKDLLFCGECGHKLKRVCTSNPKTYRVSVRTYSYGCPYARRIDGLKCDNHFLAQNALNMIVRETLQKEFDLSGIRVKTFVEFNRKQAEQKKKSSRKREKEIQLRIQELDMDMSSQYIQYRTGRIDKEMFLDRKSEKEVIKGNLAEELSRQQAEEKRIDREAEDVNRWIRLIWRGRKEAELDSEIMHSLVHKIVIFKDRHVEITFNFSRETFEKYKEAYRR